MRHVQRLPFISCVQDTRAALSFFKRTAAIVLLEVCFGAQDGLTSLASLLQLRGLGRSWQIT